MFLTAPAYPLTPTPAQARSWLLEELAGREYAHGDSLLSRFLHWLWELLSGVTGLQPPTWQLLAVGLGLVALVSVIAWRVAGPVRLARQHRVAPLFAADDVRTAADWRAEAEALAAQGDWSGAFVATFRAVVRGAQEQLAVPEQTGQTAQEAAVALGLVFPAFGSDVSWAARRFDATMYGEQTVSQADYQRLRELDTSVQQTRPRRAQALVQVS